MLRICVLEVHIFMRKNSHLECLICVPIMENILSQGQGWWLCSHSSLRRGTGIPTFSSHTMNLDFEICNGVCRTASTITSSFEDRVVLISKVEKNLFEIIVWDEYDSYYLYRKALYVTLRFVVRIASLYCVIINLS